MQYFILYMFTIMIQSSKDNKIKKNIKRKNGENSIKIEKITWRNMVRKRKKLRV